MHVCRCTLLETKQQYQKRTDIVHEEVERETAATTKEWRIRLISECFCRTLSRGAHLNSVLFALGLVDDDEGRFSVGDDAKFLVAERPVKVFLSLRHLRVRTVVDEFPPLAIFLRR